MLDESFLQNWCVTKIGVIGPGIVGMPMAALLADASIQIGSQKPARVIVVQRKSVTSGWKVEAINSGRSPIGGIEPFLDGIVSRAVAAGRLSATHNYSELSDADAILICVQTDKHGLEPDYGPLFDALDHLIPVLKKRPAGKIPVIIFESTLAPSSMHTVIQNHFAQAGLLEGRDLLLGNSPNRVMPGRLVERIKTSDKIVAGIHPLTPRLIQRLYASIVTEGTLLPTNSLTAEVVKTLENAYRDVRIAFSSEVVRFCDEQGIDYYPLRDRVNRQVSQADDASMNPNSVPSGALLIPTIGVGGHCLPKDGILLWWRRIERGADTRQSLILMARTINEESPSATIRLVEKTFGDISGQSIALLGAAYRFNSEDTRNSPTLALAKQLLDKACAVTIHDPFVKVTDQNLKKFNLQLYFTNDLDHALEKARVVIFCTAHQFYLQAKDQILAKAPFLHGIIDGCNLFRPEDFNHSSEFTGIGRGTKSPEEGFVHAVGDGFRAVERGLANEVLSLITFLNDTYAKDRFNQIVFQEVQRLAATCTTGCKIADYGPLDSCKLYPGFSSRLADCARQASPEA